MNNFKKNLVMYRKQMNLTQKKLAELLNISTNNIGHWEKGRTEPNINTILKIAELFEISTDDLLK